MKNYYEILDLEEEASPEEIRARWAELTKLYHPDVLQSPEADERIREINEAYQVLKDYSSRLEYDLERAFKKSILKKVEERKRRKLHLQKTIIVGSLLVTFVVIGSYFLFLRSPQVAQEPIKVAPIQIVKIIEPSKPEKLYRPEKLVKPEKPLEAPRVIPKETPRMVIPEPAKVVEPKKPEKPDRLKKPEEPKKPEKPVVVAKVAPPEPPKVVVSEPAKVIEAKKIEKPAEPKKPEEPKRPEEPRKPEKIEEPEKPIEVAKVAPLPKEAPKAVVPEPAKVIEPRKPEEPKKPEKPDRPERPEEPGKPEKIKEPEKPIEVAKVAPFPKEAPKVVVPEPAKVIEAKKTEKPAEPKKPEKPAPFREEEVKKFFAGYVDKYNQKDIEGFLANFSPKAIQNQKYGMDALKKIYANFFLQSEDLKYKIGDIQTDPHPQGVEVKARYELNQVAKKGGEKKVWRGQARWILIRENGTLKVLSLDYQHQR